MQSINVSTLHQKLNNNETLCIVDVRTRAEFHSERPAIKSLNNHPLNSIEGLNLPKDQTIYLMCQSGNRSTQAYQRLHAAGYTNLINVEGGLIVWKQNALPITKTAGTFPVMRQVQIAAGSLVLLGSIGSIVIHPTLIWLSVFVGAGLTFAGLSGFCGMAILLGKMPWNKSMQHPVEAST